MLRGGRRSWGIVTVQRALGVGVVFVAASAGLGVESALAGGSADRAVEGRASAQGVRIGYRVPSYFVVEQFMDAGGPVAQSLVDSTGQALSFGSLPYPSETVVTINGAMSVLSGQPVPPLYPLYAEADYPVTEKSEVTDPSGSYLLRAVTGPGKADGLATARNGSGGDPVASATALTTAVLDAGAVTTVTAESVATGISVGGVLRIASVRSRSVTKLAAADRAPVPTTELVVEGARVNNQAVTIDSSGVHSPGGQDPIGALKQAGISVRWISAQPVEGGAAADMLEITDAHTYPAPGQPKGTLVMRFGGATTSILIGADEPTAGEAAGSAAVAAAEPAAPTPAAIAPTPVAGRTPSSTGALGDIAAPGWSAPPASVSGPAAEHPVSAGPESGAAMVDLAPVVSARHPGVAGERRSLAPVVAACAVFAALTRMRRRAAGVWTR